MRLQCRPWIAVFALLFGCPKTNNGPVDANTGDGGDGSAPHGQFADISDPSQGIPEGPLGFRPQSSVLDTISNQVLVVGDSPGHLEQLELNCRTFDGSACTTPFSLLCDDSSGCGYTPAAALALPPPLPHPELLVVASDANEGLRITQCTIGQPLDSAHCTHAAATARDGSAIISGTPAIAVEPNNDTLLVATASTSVSLVRCGLDGSNCARAVATTATHPLAFPQIAIDLSLNNAVVAYYDASTVAGGLSMLVCPLTGLGSGLGFGTCVVQTIDPTAQSGLWPSITYDPVDATILVAAEDDATGETPSFYRCVPDTSGPYTCTKFDLSSLAGPGAGYTPWITTTPNEILMTTMNANDNFYPWLFRCSLEGTNCTAQNWSGDNAPVNDSGYFPIALAYNSTLYIVSHWLDQANPRVYVPTMVSGPL